MHKIKLVGTTEIDGALDKSQDYSLALERVAIKKTTITDGDKEDVITYSLESLGNITIIGAGATLIKGKTKSQSQKLRNLLYFKAIENDREQEEFYNDTMSKIMANIDTIINL